MTEDTEAWDLDPATVQMIKDRFDYREICDDDKMHLYFNRTLNTIRDRYKNILRVETIKFDPLVSKYFEGEFTTEGSNTGGAFRTINNTKTMNKGATSETLFSTEMETSLQSSNDFTSDYTKSMNGRKDVTDNTDSTDNKSYSDTKNTNGSNGGTSTTNSSSNETTGNNNSSTDVNHSTELNRHAIKQAPMNAVGVTCDTRGGGQAATEGMLDELDFEYATMYEQSDKENNGTSTHTETGNSSTTGAGTSTTTDNYTNQSRDSLTGSSSGSGSVDRVIAETNRDTDTLHQEDGTEYSDHGHEWGGNRTVVSNGGANRDVVSGTDNTNNFANTEETRHERYTGRDNVLPQDAMNKAINFLEQYSTAFEWLCNKLEINFIGIYDI